MEYSSSSLPASSMMSDQHDLAGMSSEMSQDIKRRSSSRSIKRRRFDDELVEYSLGLPAGTGVSKVARSRTHSLSNPHIEVVSPGAVLPPSIANPAPPIEIVKKRPPPKSIAPGVGVSVAGLGTGHKGRHKKKGGPPPQLTTKDLGRWKPTDDLALVIAVQQTNDMRMIHRSVKFSCRFTVQEIQHRWYALLYDESVSRVAAAAMRNLHPELVANVQAKALYSTAEEELLGTIKSTDSPTLESFETLLSKNPGIFYHSRTPKTLMTYWNMLKTYQLLPDQMNTLPLKEQLFVEMEQLISNTDVIEPREEWLDTEINHTDRKNKREIRQLEDELGRWQVLVDSVSGMRPPEFDNQTLAILRGRQVRYLMRSREITVGRCTKDHEVDVDLTLEGPVWKISRRQGTIRLRNNGDFFISSEGKRPIYVDGRPILQGNKFKLSHNCTIEIASLKFIFLINHNLMTLVRHESAKLNLPNF